jgi:hypothetical protein
VSKLNDIIHTHHSGVSMADISEKINKERPRHASFKDGTSIAEAELKRNFSLLRNSMIQSCIIAAGKIILGEVDILER